MARNTTPDTVAEAAAASVPSESTAALKGCVVTERRGVWAVERDGVTLGTFASIEKADAYIRLHL